MQLLPETTYHIYTHANGSENLFRTDNNYRYFLKKYAAYIYPVAETYAYCLMPNHLHLAVKIRPEKEILENIIIIKEGQKLQDFKSPLNVSGVISQQFSNLFNAYTKAYNKMYERKGSLFAPNFKRKEVRDNRYFTELIVYIHNNPVRHGFVKDPMTWLHSSLHAYMFDKPSKLNRQYLLDWVGDKHQLLMLHENAEYSTLFEF